METTFKTEDFVFWFQVKFFHVKIPQQKSMLTQSFVPLHDK